MWQIAWTDILAIPARVGDAEMHVGGEVAL